MLVPCRGRAPIERRYARRTGWATSCRGDDLRGTAVKWENHRMPGTRAFVVELGGGGLSAHGARVHARAAMLAAAGR